MIRNVLETLALWSGWRDSNSRHPAPKAGALPDCATPRKEKYGKTDNGFKLGMKKQEACWRTRFGAHL